MDGISDEGEVSERTNQTNISKKTPSDRVCAFFVPCVGRMVV